MTRVQAKTDVQESLAFLIQDALERSEVVIAAESIVEQLQSIAEDLANIEAKDIMPLFDALTNAFGPDVAQKFNQVATEQVRQLIGAVQTAKASLDGEIVRLKKGVEGGPMDDMAMGAAPLPSTIDTGAPDGGEPGGPAGPGLSDVPPEAGPPPEGDMGGDAAGIGPSVGRLKKEAVQPKGKLLNCRIRRPGQKPIKEFTQPPHESVNLAPNLQNLAMFHGGAGRLAQGIANMIRTDELSLDQRKALANVLSHLASVSGDPTHWSGVDADTKLDGALKAAGLWKIDSPNVQRIVQQMKRLAYLLNLHHEQITESNIKMLRKSSNPDALILKTFRTKLAENRDGQMAAIRTARTFAIDVEDVVAVVREAAARRPFNEAHFDFKKLKSQKPGGDDGRKSTKGMFKKAGREKVSEETPMQPSQPNQVQPNQPGMDQEIPIFPVEQGRSVQAGGMPSAPNAAAMQPTVMTPPGATQKPLTPADMRLRQQQQQAQKNQQGQIAASVQQATTQPSAPMPGQVLNKNDPALKRQVNK